MSDWLTIVFSAFAAGLFGSAHCLGMCAGISGLFSLGATDASVRTQLPLALAYNGGRVLSYALLGLLVGSVGNSVVSAIPALAGPLRFLSGALIIAVGLTVAFGWRFLTLVEKAGARIWQRLAPLARNLLPATTLPRATGLGLVWGWLPCGLVYSALLIAATTANALAGALVMFAFGLGTMPAMVVTGLGATTLSAFIGRNRLGAGVLIIILGLLTVAFPLSKLIGNADSSMQHQHSAAL